MPVSVHDRFEGRAVRIPALDHDRASSSDPALYGQFDARRADLIFEVSDVSGLRAAGA